MAAEKNYQEKTEAQLNRWYAKTESLLAKAKQQQATGLVKQLEALVSKQGTAQGKLQALKQAGEGEKDTVKAELENILDQLRQDLERVEATAGKTLIKSIGWAEGLADKDPVESIGWAEGLASEQTIHSAGWVQGLADEDPVESVGWAQGYESKNKRK